MRLSDIMSAMHLDTYAEVALVLFMLTFFAIAVNVFRRRNAAAWERARHLPLELELAHQLGASRTSDAGTSASQRSL